MTKHQRYLAGQVRRSLKARFPGCDAWQIHMNGAKDFQSPEGIRVAPALALPGTLI